MFPLLPSLPTMFRETMLIRTGSKFIFRSCFIDCGYLYYLSNLFRCTGMPRKWSFSAPGTTTIKVLMAFFSWWYINWISYFNRITINEKILGGIKLIIWSFKNSEDLFFDLDWNCVLSSQELELIKIKRIICSLLVA